MTHPCRVDAIEIIFVFNAQLIVAPFFNVLDALLSPTSE